MVMGDMNMTVDVVVIGAGAGGCSAALRASELGFDVALVDTFPSPGGAYLHRTCVPSQALLNIVHTLHNPLQKSVMASYPDLDSEETRKLLQWQKNQLKEVSDSLSSQCKEAGVLYIQGKAHFQDSTNIRLKDSEVNSLSCQYTVLAAGSHSPPLAVDWPGAASRILTPSQALASTEFPQSVVIVGGGQTGLELATIYSSFCPHVDIFEKHEKLLPFLDDDIVDYLMENGQEPIRATALSAEVTDLRETGDGIEVIFSQNGSSTSKSVEQVIVATGRVPSSENLGLENTRVTLSRHGFIVVDECQRTHDPHIFAIGDIASPEMYANVAARQGRIAAEGIAGLPSAFDVRATPQTISICPPVSWCGISENEALKRNIRTRSYSKSWKHYPKAATGESDGLTKVLAAQDDGRILGATIVGEGSENLIGEFVLAIEMGALVEDLTLILESHPSFSAKSPFNSLS